MRHAKIRSISQRACTVLAFALFATATQADIFRWDNGQLIPGTEGITPGPDIYLADWNSASHNLRYADFSGGLDLHGSQLYQSFFDNARFTQANLSNAVLFSSTLTNADLSQCNLTQAELFSSTLANANLEGAVITGANFGNTTSRGFTKEQLYSTASYQTRDLSGIELNYNHLGGWNLARMNLSGASFGGAILSGVDLTDAVVSAVNLRSATSRGFTKEQLYSTASYQTKSLQGIDFEENNLAGWDFHEQNLANSDLSDATLTNANLADAVVTGARFWRARGFTKEQLYSTASYQAKNLEGIDLGVNHLTGWDLSGQNLTEAGFSSATLTNADLAEAVVRGANFLGTTDNGFTKEQLYTTASYQAKTLQGIGLGANDLTGWNFEGQNLDGANFDPIDHDNDVQSNLTNANFSHARLVGANFTGVTLTNSNMTDAVVNGANFRHTTSRGFTQEQLYSTASYKAKLLGRIGLADNDLTGWNFEGQNLDGANFGRSRQYAPGSNLTNANLSHSSLVGATFDDATLTNADLSDAIVIGASFGITTSRGFTKEQLYSTASYKANNLQAIALWGDDLSGWNFTGQNLTGADLHYSILTNANLTDAVVKGMRLWSTTRSGFTKEQLYSTASYKAKDLARIDLAGNDVSGWNFRGQNLVGANFDGSDVPDIQGGPPSDSILTNADFSFADLRGASGVDITRVAIVRNTILPNGTIEGLDLDGGEELVIRDYPLGVHIQTAMSLANGSVLRLVLADNEWDSEIEVDEGIVTALSGTLALDFADGVDVGSFVGTTYDLFNWNQSLEGVGAFSLTTQYLWDLTNLYTSGEVRLTGTGGVADYDQSGLVDQGDLDLVLLHWGNELMDPLASGWTNDLPVGHVDQSELDKVLLNWGRQSAALGLSSPSIPEPAAVALLGICVLVLIAARVLRYQVCTVAVILVVLSSTTAHADVFRWDTGQLIPGTEGITAGPGVYLWSWNTESHNLRYAEFSGQDLTDANFELSWLDSARFTDANLTYADLSRSTLASANLTGAVVTGTALWDTTSRGFTQAQLASTASYQTKNLEGINLSQNILTGWDFSGQDLTRASLVSSTLANANLSGANLTRASLVSSTLANANLTGAVVTGAFLWDTTLRGFTQAQLASTASYQAKNLQGIQLSHNNNLTGWDFSGQDLTGAHLYSSTLTNANLSGALVTGAQLHGATSRGFTQAQLASTASYQAKNLQFIGLAENNLTGWDFSGQDLTGVHLYSATLTNANLAGANLTGAYLYSSTLTNANLTGALVTGAQLHGATSGGFTAAQLTSTASYQAKNLQGIGLAESNLTGWDFSGQNLSSANLNSSTLTNANLAGANLTHANLDSSMLTNANLSFADMRGAFGANISNVASLRNSVLPDGTIAGLDLPAGERLVVRDDDGVPDIVFARAPIPLTVDEHLTIVEGGVLELRVDADPWDSLISFEPGVPVALGGTLELLFTPDADVGSQVGRTLHIFDWTGVEPAGAFHVASPYLWDLTNLYTTGEVRLTGTGGVADYDQNGLVDQGDLDLVLLNWGGELIDPAANGWVNDLPNGLVDQGELDKVLLTWGTDSIVVGVAAVPEPSTAALVLIASLALFTTPVLPRRLCAMALILLLSLNTGQADIFRWDTGEVIPGTEGITPGPYIHFSSAGGLWTTESHNLRYADFSGGLDLSNSKFFNIWLDNSLFTGANLSNASLAASTLTDANLTGALVTGADFSGTTWRGFTQSQLASTASYQAKDLQGISLTLNDLSGWDFRGQNLAGAEFNAATLKGANLSGANLSGAYLNESTLTNANFTRANLTSTSLYGSTLTNANFDGAVVTGASLGETTSLGFTQAQLESTASYQAKNLRGIRLDRNNLTGWNFTGQDLSQATLIFSTLSNANLSLVNLTGADLVRSTLRSANLTGANLANASFYHPTGAGGDLTDANLADANLANANLEGVDLTNTNLSGADLRGALGAGLARAITTNAILPDGSIQEFALADGQSLTVRDYDGDSREWRTLDPIAVTVRNAMRLSEGALLQLVFEADPWDSLISFEAGIPVELGGTLELTFADDVDASTQIGRTIDVFDWTGVEPIGTYTIASPYLWDLRNLYTTGEVRLTGTGGVADYDLSSLVEQADLDLVLLNWGADATVPPAGWINDLPSGLVDQDELDKVLLNWGSQAAAGLPAASVPEPTSAAALLVVMACIAAWVGLEARRRNQD